MRERSTQCPDCSEAEGLTLRQWKQGYGEVGGGGSMGWGGGGRGFIENIVRVMS